MSTIEKKSAISSDYVVYLQEFDFYEPLMIQKCFHKRWVAKNQNYGLMLLRMRWVTSNRVWDLVELPNKGRLGLEDQERLIRKHWETQDKTHSQRIHSK